jgi:hypothetical protein
MLKTCENRVNSTIPNCHKTLPCNIFPHQQQQLHFDRHKNIQDYDLTYFYFFSTTTGS